MRKVIICACNSCYLRVMKRITSIGLICLMWLPGLYNMGVITYFQMNRQYIADVLCINKDKPMAVCNGQCFLQQNLDVPSAGTEDQSMPSGKDRLEFSVFLVFENAHVPGLDSDCKEDGSLYLPGTSSAYRSKPFHPPAFLS